MVDARGLGIAASALIGLSVVLDGLSVWSDWHTRQVVDGYLNDLAGVTRADLLTADQITLVTSLASLVIMVAAAIVFIVWLWRVRLNAEALAIGHHHRSRGWVVGSWICPVVNLWFPFQVVSDIWKASKPANRAEPNLSALSGSARLDWWWRLYVGGNLVNWIAWRVGREPTIESLRNAALADTAAFVLTTGSAVLVIQLIREINAWQAQSRPAISGGYALA
ncbi:DUF4328 domain-containing protein [Amycolatopsis xylanica]|uniref:DUF4328 domain-containing protein n=1 Tax=Amycolatopsis xylanica TaxID=589385 RepID=UPI0015A05E45|nr:DUF4328 domain-containing protein [Amycolatopsis xylanica]